MLVIPDCESPQCSAVSGLSSTEKEKNVVKLLPWISCFPDDAQSSTDNKKKQRRMNTPWIEVAEDDAENSTEEEQKVELVVWTR